MCDQKYVALQLCGWGIRNPPANFVLPNLYFLLTFILFPKYIDNSYIFQYNVRVPKGS